VRGATRQLFATSAARKGAWAAVVILLVLLVPRPGHAQERGAAVLNGLVNGLGNTARVLMIGAHPDDEDTSLIAWLARGRNVETAYLSLTRGDGGQNLIGNELGVALGVIRTEELLAARRIDGGRQFFTRAYDFGFSKSAEETYRHWPREELLRDVVTVVRAFRPHVIVSVFSGTPRDGHGHHQVAGMLAREAYDIAGDSVAMPRSATRGVGAWTPLKFYRGQRGNAQGATVGVNVGEYDPVSGRSFAELAGLSRSQHQSQGFGSVQRRGPLMNHVRLEASRVGDVSGPERSMFDGIDTTWRRFAGEGLPAAARAAIDSVAIYAAVAGRALDLRAPGGSVPAIAGVVRVTTRAIDLLTCNPADGSSCAPPRDLCPVWNIPLCHGLRGDLLVSLHAARDRAARALAEASGVAVEGFVARSVVAVGDSVPVTVEVYNQGAQRVDLLGATITIERGIRHISDSAAVAPDSFAVREAWVTPRRPSMPWWTAVPARGAMFDFGESRSDAPHPWWMHATPQLLLGEDRLAESAVQARLRIAGTELTVRAAPIVHRFVDPVYGERRRPVAAVPPISLLLEREVEYAPAGLQVERVVPVYVASAAPDPRDVLLSLDLPAGMRADSATRRVRLEPGAMERVDFLVRGSLAPGQHLMGVVATSGDDRFTTGQVVIEYPHIRPQLFHRAAMVQLSSVDIVVPRGLRVGYIPGVGDNVAPALQQLGVSVTILDRESIDTVDFSRFTTVVVGPRAFEANVSLRRSAGRLLDFARNGGRVVAQFGQYEMQQPGILPYPITIHRPHDRVTEEDSPVTITSPQARVLTTPNRITTADFEGWVQERSVYMPRTFDERYESVLEMNDPGESPSRAGILVARVGRGSYVYTTLSFFRQLPAGNPGAARLFVNLLTPEGMR
jgi:LmbE family N-acetylglucosaminyl deacetylase